MHMQGEPRTMQQNPHYDDVVGEVGAFLAARVQACRDAGIPDRQLLIDPGFGFGKTVRHNLQLLNALDSLRKIGAPLLVGLSRKSFLAPCWTRRSRHACMLSGRSYGGSNERGSVGTRHDVGPTVEALKLCAALEAL